MNDEDLKKAAAQKALEWVEDGMRLGIGTGSTAEAFIRLLAERVKEGLKICGVATSNRSEALCQALGIPTTSLGAVSTLDLTVDGADEIGPRMALLKGGGGALLREKIVAYASKKMLVIADESKLVTELGAFPLPIEVNAFGFEATKRAIIDVACAFDLPQEIILRVVSGAPFYTDGGHLILDAAFGKIADPYALSQALFAIPGVVEHGLFLDLASACVVAGKNGGVTILT
ncbi:ribose-5-phosphate isomerase RpiA [Bartonella sp. DGB2]|uniref:ribose-5-phosphate isomerase RpiA n=1 Tax=Bartonella sp. DGB2 TaxID=3388426 RepID=UPI003990058A